MDLEVEYANRFGTPRDDEPWHRFLAYVERTGRLEARDFLREMDTESLGQPMPDASLAGQKQLFRLHLERLARGESDGV